jgi:hypothetical protein
MRSTATISPGKRAPGAARAVHRVRRSTRRSARPLPPRIRRTTGQARGGHRLSRAGIAARAPLERVRPLKVIPRGVVPYVKH